VSAVIRALLLVPLAGCHLLFDLESVSLGPDAPTSDVMPDSRMCYGRSFIQPCLEQPLPSPLALVGTIDTDTDPRCIEVVQPSTTAACVIAAQSIAITGALTAVGSRPLVLVADGAIDLSGTLDVSSNETRTGAGAQASCGTAGNGTANVGGGGGGAGGAFGFPGGNPQPGGSDPTTAHGASPPVTAAGLADVRGGCPGYTGATRTSSGAGAAEGGAGGGAVWLIAETINVMASGRINASGAGGRGGMIGGGGGGGGAGGLIGLEATSTITIAGEIFALGAGGASGGSTTHPGLRGGEPTGPSGPANGGAFQIQGVGSGSGAPGCGWPAGMDGGNNTSVVAAAGGGGGGGSCGIIFFVGISAVTGETNPAPTNR